MSIPATLYDFFLQQTGRPFFTEEERAASERRLRGFIIRELTTMSAEDDKNLYPVTLHHVGSSQLPDGREQMAFRCPNMAEYLQMPKTLKIGGAMFRLAGWDSERGIAYYRTEMEDLTQEVIE